MSERVGSIGLIPLGVIYLFVIHMGSMVAGTTATPPPPSKDTSSIDLDMLFADW